MRCPWRAAARQTHLQRQIEADYFVVVRDELDYAMIGNQHDIIHNKLDLIGGQ